MLYDDLAGHAAFLMAYCSTMMLCFPDYEDASAAAIAAYQQAGFSGSLSGNSTKPGAI